MIKRTVWILVRFFAVLLIGLISAVIGFVVGSIIFTTFIPEFVIFGKEGYEAGGPIGLLLGALIGLIGGGMLLFGERRKKTIDT